MSWGYLEDKILEVLGGEYLEDADARPVDWSPNQYKELYIFPNLVAVREHIDSSLGTTLPMDEDEIDIQGNLDLDSILSMRNLGTLEGVYVDPRLGGIATAREFIPFLAKPNNRFHQVGEVVLGKSGPEPSNVEEVEGTEGWENKANLQPAHYKMDEQGGKLWAHFDALKKASEEESLDELEQEVADYFADAISGTVNKILVEYGRVFASGYEIIQPAGVIVENKSGYGVLATIDEDSKLEKSKLDRNIQYLYSYLKQKMGLVEVPVRDIKAIANTIVNGTPERGGKVYEGNITFPYKTLEYAFGCADQASSGNDLQSYPPHSLRSEWGSYARDEVTKSITRVLNQALVFHLKHRGLFENYADPEANREATELLNKFQDAFCTLVLVSGYDVTGGSLVSMKVRVLDPNNSLSRHENILESVLKKSMNSLDGAPGLVIRRPRVEGDYFVEYSIELDTKLANAEPLFAYRALESMLKRGKTINYDNVILGKALDDSILTNGGKINLRKKLSHCVVAGSRAGKGVWTFSMLSGSTVSRRALFYLDNKPDMASVIKMLGPNGFVLNGQNLSPDKESGTDFFEQFHDVDNLITADKFPQYLNEVFGGNKYSDVGAYVYLRGLIFILGIISARAKDSKNLPLLGGEEGITVVIDELAVTNNGLMALFSRAKRFMAMTKYAADLKNGSQVKEEDKPTKASYWWVSFYENLQRSMDTLQQLSYAGLRNAEAGRSDIFILTQEPPQMVNNSTEAGELFAVRNKGTNGIRGGIDNPALLPTFALPGEADVFIGFDLSKRSFLAQGDPRSPASEYLNEVQRGFGYVDTYTNKTREDFDKISLAEKATYYRPMLVFADESVDNYFARNALKYASDVGADTKNIIHRNSALNDKIGRNAGNNEEFHSGVSFNGYLKMAGMSDEEITSTLNESGNIAQTVVDKLGYPGTWMEFIMDFRPEWLFSIQDIINAMNGTKLNEDTASRNDLWEFITVYPDEFNIDSSTDEFSDGPTMYDVDGTDLDGNSGYIDQGLDEEDLDLDQVSFTEETNDDSDEFSENSSQHGQAYNEYTGEPLAASGTGGSVGGSAAFGSPSGVGGHSTTSGPVAGHSGAYTAPPGTPGAAWVRMGDAEADEAYNAVGGSDVSGIDDLDTSQFDTGSYIATPDWSDPSSAGQAINQLNERLHSGDVQDDVNTKTFGAGYYTDPNGNADNYRVNVQANELPIDDPFDADNLEESIANIMEAVTVGMLHKFNGIEGIKSIRIVGTTVIVNNMYYNDKLPERYLNSLPVDMKSEVSSGNLARLLDWATIRKLKGIVRLSFDSAEYAYDYVAPGMGWGGRVSVDDFFNTMRRLRSLTIGNQVFDRSTYRNQINQNDAFYEPRAVRQMSDAIDRAFSRGVSSTWNYTRTTFNRRDIGLGSKILRMSGGLIGTAATGSASVGSKFGRSLMNLGRSVKSMVEDTRRL